MTAISIVLQFESKAILVGVPRALWMRILPFVLKDPVHSRFKSSGNKFEDFEGFCKLYIKYYHSEDITCAKLA